jgi:tRNA (cytidine/uridine-2'-O-)-methyltransferase
MDYLDLAEFSGTRRGRNFSSSAWAVSLSSPPRRRPYHRFAFAAEDIVLLGRESVGVPDHVHDGVEARLRIPLRPGARSLNVALAAAMVLGEALRQTDEFPMEATA